MIPISYKKVSFKNSEITIIKKSKKIVIKITDVFAMAYKKPSVKNYFTTLKGDRLGLGILYIATKKAKIFKDIVQIRIPYSKLKEIPTNWFTLVEFYSFGVSLHIYEILYKGL
ncbi:MAG: hypothetical protein IJ186_02810 [Bacilli bacterium]|nr:hypothetical protein [Bacilli bacterium]